jgi:hypothetical protein
VISARSTYSCFTQPPTSQYSSAVAAATVRSADELSEYMHHVTSCTLCNKTQHQLQAGGREGKQDTHYRMLLYQLQKYHVVWSCVVNDRRPGCLQQQPFAERLLAHKADHTHIRFKQAPDQRAKLDVYSPMRNNLSRGRGSLK